MSRGQEKYLTRTTPIFDRAMGGRLSQIRQRMYLKQDALGKLLGVSQTIISRLETGRAEHCRISTGRFKAVLGIYFEFFLTGEGVVNFPRDHYEKVRERKRSQRVVGIKV